MSSRRKTQRDDIRRAKRVVASAYVMTHASGATLAEIRALEMEYAAFEEATAEQRRQGRVRSGRHVFGRAVAAVILATGLIFGARAILRAAPRLMLIAATQAAQSPAAADAPPASRTMP
ncbi:MAG: hypothetical protein ABJE47_08920 [bacterium]